MPAFFTPGRGAMGLRPFAPAAINGASYQAPGLVACFEGSSAGVIRDLRSGLSLSGTNEPVPTLTGGLGHRFNAGNARQFAATPTRLQLALPITFDCWIYQLGTPDNFAAFFGVLNNNTVSPPYTAYSLQTSLGTYEASFNGSGLSGPAASIGLHHLYGCVTSSYSLFMVDGMRATSSVSATPAYSGTSEVFAGEAWSSLGRNSNSVFICGRIWQRDGNDWFGQQLYAPQTRWDLYYVHGRRIYFDLAAGGGSFKSAWAARANTVIRAGRLTA